MLINLWKLIYSHDDNHFPFFFSFSCRGPQTVFDIKKTNIDLKVFCINKGYNN